MQIVDLLLEVDEAAVEKIKRNRRTKKQMAADLKISNLARKANGLPHQRPNAKKKRKIAKTGASLAAPIDVENEETLDNGTYAVMDEAYDMLTYFDSDVMFPHTSVVGKMGSIETIKFVCDIETDDPEDVKKEINIYDRYIKKVEALFDGYDVKFDYKPFPKTSNGSPTLTSKLTITVK